MTNHIHLIAVPETDDGLQGVLKPLHMRYAQRINRERGWKGHYGKGDFFHRPREMPIYGLPSGMSKNGHQSGRLFLVECRGALWVKERCDIESKV